VPTLLETQRAMRASLVDGDDRAATAMLADGIGADRLNIYRNTFVGGITKALRLTYPAVHRLVGADFFEGATARFIAQHPPGAACLDEYGAEFPEFLRNFEPAAMLVYLADVARLEWAVSRALHAPDVEPLDLARLAALSPQRQARVCFVPHPSIALLCADYPIDTIWRGVLDGDDAALAAVALDAGPVRLLVERRATGLKVSRFDEAAWCFAAALFDGWSVEEALAGAAGTSADALLAEHLLAGRFVDFRQAPPRLRGSLAEMRAAAP
jgi:Putative DNA-binding domain